MEALAMRWGSVGETCLADNKCMPTFCPCDPSLQVIPAEQVRKGFQAVIDSIEDTVLDVPDAAELLSLFIARAVVDDVLPPAVAAKWVQGCGLWGPPKQVSAGVAHLGVQGCSLLVFAVL